MSELSTSARCAAHIRLHIFGVHTQAQFAEMLGRTQATIARYETGEIRLNPNYQEAVRALAKSKGVKWDDSYFFEVPKSKRRAA